MSLQNVNIVMPKQYQTQTKKEPDTMRNSEYIDYSA